MERFINLINLLILMVCQINTTRKGIGVLVNDEVKRRVIDTKEKTHGMIVEWLDSFYRGRGLQLDTEHVEHETRPREKGHYRVYDGADYHGSVDVLYYDLQTRKDFSVKPPYVFDAECFGIFFHVGIKEMDVDLKIERSDVERMEFREYAKRMLRL